MSRLRSCAWGVIIVSRIPNTFVNQVFFFQKLEGRRFRLAVTNGSELNSCSNPRTGGDHEELVCVLVWAWDVGRAWFSVSGNQQKSSCGTGHDQEKLKYVLDRVPSCA